MYNYDAIGIFYGRYEHTCITHDKHIPCNCFTITKPSISLQLNWNLHLWPCISFFARCYSEGSFTAEIFCNVMEINHINAYQVTRRINIHLVEKVIFQKKNICWHLYMNAVLRMSLKIITRDIHCNLLYLYIWRGWYVLWWNWGRL